MNPNDKIGQCRLVVSETVFHHHEDGRPAYLESRFHRALHSIEQAYIRTVRVDEQWQPLELGWLENITLGMVIIRNEAGKFTKMPTDEERKAEEDKVIQIHMLPYGQDPVLFQSAKLLMAHITIDPQESTRFKPAHGMRVMIRCASGWTRYTALIIPS